MQVLCQVIVFLDNGYCIFIILSHYDYIFVAFYDKLVSQVVGDQGAQDSITAYQPIHHPSSGYSL